MPEQAPAFPPELIEELHAARERFHESRAEWEKTLAGSQYRHEERVDAARQKLREAETEIESVEARIAVALKAIH